MLKQLTTFSLKAPICPIKIAGLYYKNNNTAVVFNQFKRFPIVTTQRMLKMINGTRMTQIERIITD
jgi:hypothetical protein